MKLTCLLTSIALIAFIYLPAQKLADPVLLWPDGAPGATGTSDEDKPAVIPFIPEQTKRNGVAVLVVPGGGFTIRAVDHEGVLVAQWLKEHGITAFLLRYRLRPIYTRNEWNRDGQRAIQYIRAHSKEYNISPDRVGAVGFSAGANLIPDMTLNTISMQQSADPADRQSARPDFMILAYGSMRIPQMDDSMVRKSFPPTFMYGTVEDRSSQGGMIDMYSRLYKAGVPVEGHFFQNGIHGTGFGIGDPVLGEWPKLMYTWLQINGWLSEKKQIPLNGIVKLDGHPLLKGMIILTPLENKNAPPVIIYINNTGTGELGRFSVPNEQGPVEGWYKVEVRQDATRWTSNSREPFMIEMMDKQAKGTLTESDRTRWADYLRKRDLSPSIYNQKVFKRKRSSDKEDYILNIRKGEEIVIEVFSK